MTTVRTMARGVQGVGMGVLRRIKDALSGGDSDGFNVTGRNEYVMKYPIQTRKHHGHERVTTNAETGRTRVCYCRDCQQHYRQFKSNLKDVTPNETVVTNDPTPVEERRP